MHEYYMLVPWGPPSFETVRSLINDRQLLHSLFEYMQEKIYRQKIINVKDMIFLIFFIYTTTPNYKSNDRAILFSVEEKITTYI